MDFWKWPFMQCVTLLVNENILQSLKSKSAQSITFLSFKRKSRLGVMKTSRFKTNLQPFQGDVKVKHSHIYAHPRVARADLGKLEPPLIPVEKTLSCERKSVQKLPTHYLLQHRCRSTDPVLTKGTFKEDQTPFTKKNYIKGKTTMKHDFEVVGEKCWEFLDIPCLEPLYTDTRVRIRLAELDKTSIFG